MGSMRKPERSFSAHHCKYRSPLIGFSSSHINAIFSLSGDKAESQAAPGRLVSGTVRMRDDAAR
jgi:hypothetical protein